MIREAPPPELEVIEFGIGVVLASERRRQGLTLEQVAAATRIRVPHLLALERDDLTALAGPVYARGYLRSYAQHLGLDPEPLLKRMPPLEPMARTSGRFLSLARLAPRVPPGLVLTAPVLTGLGLLLLLGLFSAYALYELRSARLDATPTPAASAAGPPPIASPAPLPSVIPTATPAANTSVTVAIRATEVTWVKVTVDGKPATGASGHMLQPGAEDSFTGQKVKIQSGKPSLLVAVGGGDYAALGVLTKEYSAQT